jgi:excisionase family DNA binding protein
MAEETNGSHNPFEGWTTIEEAAEIVGRPKGTVRRWAEQGFINSHPLGRKVRAVNIEELKAYAAAHQPHRKKQYKTT